MPLKQHLTPVQPEPRYPSASLTVSISGAARLTWPLGGGEVGLVATPKEVAQWMVAQLEEGDRLLQIEAVIAIEKLFGSEFVYLSDIGEKSINRRVLNQFRKLTEDEVVWVTQQGGGYWSGAHWRKREPGDSSGRTQYEY